MPRYIGPVLVDTNVVLECWRVGSWRALAGGYSVETVEDCVTETQTGFQRRRPEQRIDAAVLRSSLARVHDVSERNWPWPSSAMRQYRSWMSANGHSGHTH